MSKTPGQRKGTVLVIEDDTETRTVLSEALEEDGYTVCALPRRHGATQALRRAAADAVVLDVWLPDGSGVDLCREWRTAGIRVPVLMLTARADVSSRVEGLDAGADDYLGKPFALSELRARLRALLRRGHSDPSDEVFNRGTLRVDFGRRQAWVDGKEVPLTRRELEVFARLVWGRGRAVAREDLLEEIWGEATEETAASLEVMVARLRRKLEGGHREAIIRTVRGHGYALAETTEGNPR